MKLTVIWRYIPFYSIGDFSGGEDDMLGDMEDIAVSLYLNNVHINNNYYYYHSKCEGECQEKR